jgi:periplasmic protein TonB
VPTRDLKTIEPVPTHMLGEAAAAVAVPVLLVVLLAIVDWRLTLALLAGLPVALVALRASGAVSGTTPLIGFRRRPKPAPASSSTDWALPTCAWWAWRASSSRSWRRRCAAAATPTLPWCAVWEKPAGYVAALDLGFPVVLLVGALLLASGAASPAEILLFLVASVRMLKPAQKLIELSAFMRLTEAALDRIDRIFGGKPLPEAPDDPAPARPSRLPSVRRTLRRSRPRPQRRTRRQSRRPIPCPPKRRWPPLPTPLPLPRRRPPTRAPMRRRTTWQAPDCPKPPPPAGGRSGRVGGAGGGGTAADNDWQRRLVAQLERHKRYPRGAQRRRVEGVAYLRFTVDRQGRVLGASLARSSGDEALDAETLALVERAQPLPPPPADLYPAQVHLTVPVQFFLR